MIFFIQLAGFLRFVDGIESSIRESIYLDIVLRTSFTILHDRISKKSENTENLSHKNSKECRNSKKNFKIDSKTGTGQTFIDLLPICESGNVNHRRNSGKFDFKTSKSCLERKLRRNQDDIPYFPSLDITDRSISDDFSFDLPKYLENVSKLVRINKDCILIRKLLSFSYKKYYFISLQRFKKIFRETLITIHTCGGKETLNLNLTSCSHWGLNNPLEESKNTNSSHHFGRSCDDVSYKEKEFQHEQNELTIKSMVQNQTTSKCPNNLIESIIRIKQDEQQAKVFILSDSGEFFTLDVSKLDRSMKSALFKAFKDSGIEMIHTAEFLLHHDFRSYLLGHNTCQLPKVCEKAIQNTTKVFKSKFEFFDGGYKILHPPWSNSRTIGERISSYVRSNIWRMIISLAPYTNIYFQNNKQVESIYLIEYFYKKELRLLYLTEYILKEHRYLSVNFDTNQKKTTKFATLNSLIISRDLNRNQVANNVIVENLVQNIDTFQNVSENTVNLNAALKNKELSQNTPENIVRLNRPVQNGNVIKDKYNHSNEVNKDHLSKYQKDYYASRFLSFVDPSLLTQFEKFLTFEEDPETFLKIKKLRHRKLLRNQKNINAFLDQMKYKILDSGKSINCRKINIHIVSNYDLHQVQNDITERSIFDVLFKALFISKSNLDSLENCEFYLNNIDFTLKAFTFFFFVDSIRFFAREFYCLTPEQYRLANFVQQEDLNLVKSLYMHIRTFIGKHNIVDYLTKHDLHSTISQKIVEKMFESIVDVFFLGNIDRFFECCLKKILLEDFKDGQEHTDCEVTYTYEHIHLNEDVYTILKETGNIFVSKLQQSSNNTYIWPFICFDKLSKSLMRYQLSNLKVMDYLIASNALLYCVYKIFCAYEDVFYLEQNMCPHEIDVYKTHYFKHIDLESKQSHRCVDNTKDSMTEGPLLTHYNQNINPKNNSCDTSMTEGPFLTHFNQNRNSENNSRDASMTEGPLSAHSTKYSTQEDDFRHSESISKLKLGEKNQETQNLELQFSLLKKDYTLLGRSIDEFPINIDNNMRYSEVKDINLEEQLLLDRLNNHVLQEIEKKSEDSISQNNIPCDEQLLNWLHTVILGMIHKDPNNINVCNRKIREKISSDRIYNRILEIISIDLENGDAFKYFPRKKKLLDSAYNRVLTDISKGADEEVRQNISCKQTYENKLKPQKSYKETNLTKTNVTESEECFNKENGTFHSEHFKKDPKIKYHDDFCDSLHKEQLKAESIIPHRDFKRFFLINIIKSALLPLEITEKTKFDEYITKFNNENDKSVMISTICKEFLEDSLSIFLTNEFVPMIILYHDPILYKKMRKVLHQIFYWTIGYHRWLTSLVVDFIYKNTGVQEKNASKDSLKKFIDMILSKRNSFLDRILDIYSSATIFFKADLKEYDNLSNTKCDMETSYSILKKVYDKTRNIPVKYLAKNTKEDREQQYSNLMGDIQTFVDFLEKNRKIFIPFSVLQLEHWNDELYSQKCTKCLTQTNLDILDPKHIDCTNKIIQSDEIYETNGTKPNDRYKDYKKKRTSRKKSNEYTYVQTPDAAQQADHWQKSILDIDKLVEYIETPSDVFKNNKSSRIFEITTKKNKSPKKQDDRLKNLNSPFIQPVNCIQIDKKASTAEKLEKSDKESITGLDSDNLYKSIGTGMFSLLPEESPDSRKDEDLSTESAISSKKNQSNGRKRRKRAKLIPADESADTTILNEQTGHLFHQNPIGSAKPNHFSQKSMVPTKNSSKIMVSSEKDSNSTVSKMDDRIRYESVHCQKGTTDNSQPRKSKKLKNLKELRYADKRLKNDEITILTQKRGTYATFTCQKFIQEKPKDFPNNNISRDTPVSIDEQIDNNSGFSVSGGNYQTRDKISRLTDSNKINDESSLQKKDAFDLKNMEDSPKIYSSNKPCEGSLKHSEVLQIKPSATKMSFNDDQLNSKPCRPNYYTNRGNLNKKDLKGKCTDIKDIAEGFRELQKSDLNANLGHPLESNDIKNLQSHLTAENFSESNTLPKNAQNSPNAENFNEHSNQLDTNDPETLTFSEYMDSEPSIPEGSPKTNISDIFEIDFISAIDRDCSYLFVTTLLKSDIFGDDTCNEIVYSGLKEALYQKTHSGRSKLTNTDSQIIKKPRKHNIPIETFMFFPSEYDKRNDFYLFDPIQSVQSKFPLKKLIHSSLISVLIDPIIKHQKMPSIYRLSVDAEKHYIEPDSKYVNIPDFHVFNEISAIDALNAEYSPCICSNMEPGYLAHLSTSINEFTRNFNTLHKSNKKTINLSLLRFKSDVCIFKFRGLKYPSINRFDSDYIIYIFKNRTICFFFSNRFLIQLPFSIFKKICKTEKTRSKKMMKRIGGTSYLYRRYKSQFMNKSSFNRRYQCFYVRKFISKKPAKNPFKYHQKYEAPFTKPFSYFSDCSLYLGPSQLNSYRDQTNSTSIDRKTNTAEIKQNKDIGISAIGYDGEFGHNLTNEIESTISLASSEFNGTKHPDRQYYSKSIWSEIVGISCMLNFHN